MLPENLNTVVDRRLEEAALALEAQDPENLLVIAVDAADNAITIAQNAIPAESCFVYDFMKYSDLPKNIHFIVSARTS
ncbi:hypothetical protein ACFL7M_00320 [Thermodesulfobacteriota bacterium]